MDFSKLKEYRLSNGMTQTDIAIAVGVSLTAYQLWERGAATPTPENLQRLLEVLKIERVD